jgi:hypothetical protein
MLNCVVFIFKPGLPVFGTKKKSTLLQGLSTTGEQFCDSKVQATVPVSLHKTWIESVITGINLLFIFIFIEKYLLVLTR